LHLEVKNGQETSIRSKEGGGICSRRTWKFGSRKGIARSGICPGQRYLGWGGGDFETALGAAAHMGRKDIANYLLAQGARLDLFAAAMLGKLESVNAVLNTYPEAKNVPGPHGIPLIAHAEAGGEEARSVAEFLASLTWIQ